MLYVSAIIPYQRMVTMKYVIFADVSCDIDKQYVDAGKIRFISMEYSLGDDMLTCSGPVSREDLKRFYDDQRGGSLTHTSQISPFMYEETLSPFMEEGYSILYLCLSSGLSSTFNSALTAKAELKEKYPDVDFYPVDTLAAAAGMGILGERAIRNMDAGMSVEDNYNDIVALVPHLRHWFLVPDLMYLKRGGRVSAATAIVGTALNICPILKINEIGKLDTFSKKRGMKMAANALVELFDESYDPSCGETVYIVDADNPEIADYIDAKIRELYPEAPIKHTGLSPIIGAHTGPDLAAIIHIGK